MYPPLISVADKYDNAESVWLYQTLGNVSEWVNGWYDQDYYKTAPDRNPKGPDSGTQKPFAAEVDGQHDHHAGSHANGTDPTTKIGWMGSRCARDAKDGVGTKVSMTKE